MHGTQTHPPIHDSYAERTGTCGNTSASSREVLEETLARFRSHNQSTAATEPLWRLHRALAVEVARMECVLGLTEAIAMRLQAARNTAVASGHTDLPSDVALQKIAQELFTSWVLAELNADGRSAAIDALVLDAAGCRHATVPDVDALLHSTVVKDGRLFTVQGFAPDDWSAALLSSVDEPVAHCTAKWKELRVHPPIPLHLDVLIPCGELNTARGTATCVFQRCLVATGSEKTAATACAIQITLDATLWRSRLTAASLQIHEAIKGNSSGPINITVEGRPGPISVPAEVALAFTGPNGEDVLLHVTGGKTSLSTIALIGGYLEKLAALYRHHSEAGCSAPKADSQLADFGHPSYARFILCASIMLLRYHSLAGAGEECDRNAGYHASVHPRFAAELNRQFGVDTDAFANPLNATQPNFYSLFPDTDAPFGSKGSFFSALQQLPNTVPLSLHVNPPFETGTIVRMVSTVLGLLESAASTTTRTCIVVVPNWSSEKLRALQKLQDSSHCVSTLLISPDEAVYVDGHQHRLRKPFFSLRSRTLLIILQNPAARLTHPADAPALGLQGVSRLDACRTAWSISSSSALNVRPDKDDRKRPRDESQ